MLGKKHGVQRRRHLRDKAAWGFIKVPSLMGVSSPVLITPEHPIRFCGGKWAFPKNLGAPIVEATNTMVYNFVLGEIACKQTPSVWVNGLECIALGHLLEDPAVKDDVWGDIAIRVLKSKPDYPIVHLSESGFDELVEHRTEQNRPSSSIRKAI